MEILNILRKSFKYVYPKLTSVNTFVKQMLFFLKYPSLRIKVVKSTVCTANCDLPSQLFTLPRENDVRLVNSRDDCINNHFCNIYITTLLKGEKHVSLSNFSPCYN